MHMHAQEQSKPSRYRTCVCFEFGAPLLHCFLPNLWPAEERASYKIQRMLERPLRGSRACSLGEHRGFGVPPRRCGQGKGVPSGKRCMSL